MSAHPLLGRAAAAVLVLFLSATSGALAQSYCDGAIDSYNTAISNLSREIASYTRCLSNSNGEDDCSREFRNLRSAHDTYENAVNAIRRGCEN